MAESSVRDRIAARNASNTPPPAKSARMARFLPVFAFLLFSCVMLGIVAASGYAGGQAGQQAAGVRRTATANGAVAKRFQDGLGALNQGDFALAQANFEEVIQRQPGNNGARGFLATAIAAQRVTATPEPTVTPEPTTPIDKDALYKRARDAFERETWDTVIGVTEQLVAIDPEFKRDEVVEMRFNALQNRGIARLRANDDAQIEGGISDLDKATAIRALPAAIDGERRLAIQFQNAITYLGADWDRAIFLLQQLPQGYRRAGQRVYQAYVDAGNNYFERADFCQAESKYANALRVAASPALQEKQRDAAQRCLSAAPAANSTPATVGDSSLLAGMRAFPASGLSGRISFSVYDAATGVYRPYIYDAASGSVAALANDFGAGSIYAPDGARYVESIYQDNAWQLVVRSGGGAAALTAGTAPQWGPSGLIAYQGCVDTCGIHVINPDQIAPPARLTSSGNDIAFKWSPQGDRLVYMSNYSGPYEIYTVSLGGDFRQLTGFGASSGAPAWSPSGAQIAFLSNREGAFALYSVNADGSGLQKLVDFGQLSPAWQSNRLAWN
jgi:hypothetical protein